MSRPHFSLILWIFWILLCILCKFYCIFMYVTMSQSCWHGGIQRGLQDSPGITFLTEPMSRKSHCESCEPILQLQILANTVWLAFPTNPLHSLKHHTRTSHTARILVTRVLHCVIFTLHWSTKGSLPRLDSIFAQIALQLTDIYFVPFDKATIEFA